MLTLEAMGVSVTVKTALFEDAPDFGRADFIYMGAGTERTQKAALSALLPHKEALKAAIDRGGGGAVHRQRHGAAGPVHHRRPG